MLRVILVPLRERLYALYPQSRRRGSAGHGQVRVEMEGAIFGCVGRGEDSRLAMEELDQPSEHALHRWLAG